MQIILLLFSVLLFSCKASKDQPKSEPALTDTPEQKQEAEQTNEIQPDAPLETLILGNWEWWKTICCGRTPFTETSESLKAPKILEFQTGGALLYYSGTELTSTQNYKISYGLVNDDRPVINIGATRPGMLYIKGDTLMIDYGYVDLQTEYYLRRK